MEFLSRSMHTGLSIGLRVKLINENRKERMKVSRLINLAIENPRFKIKK